MDDFLKISEFSEVTTGGTPSTKVKEYWDGGEIPWLNSGELNQDIVTESSNYITELGLNNSSTRLMPPNTVLIALTGATTGKVGFLKFEACANQSVTGILPSLNHDSKYLYYYLNSIRPRVLNDAYGGAQPHISQGYVKNIKVPLPILSTQKKIAAILDKADTLRQNDKKILEKYDQLAQSVFLEMFGDPGSNKNKIELSALGKACYFIKDGPHVSPKYVSDGIPFISVNNIINGTWDFSKVRYISKEDHELFKRRCNPEMGDVLYTKGGTTGFAKYIDIDLEFSNWVHLAVLKFEKHILNGIFLEHMLNSRFCYFQSQLYTRGIANRDLVLSQMKRIQILVPTIKLQNRFAEIIKHIENQKQLTQQSLQKSEELFQSLLQRAFKGELV